MYLANRFRTAEISDCDIWATSNFAYIYDSRNIVIARNRVRYGEFGLRLGHSVRALIEGNDVRLYTYSECPLTPVCVLMTQWGRCV